MPSKTEEYLALAQRTANGLTRYWESWTDYLTTASRLYKYPFADQLMIYAQRPDATACADYDIWNNRMNRYVRRGSKGIALLDESSGYPRLHYVFDVSDTGVRRNSRDPDLWQYNDDLKQPVSDALTAAYGISHERFSQQLADIAGKLVADYWDNNSEDIRAIVDGSFLMDYDSTGLEMQFKSAAAISVTYTLLERCGFEPDGFFDKDSFQAIYDFSTPDTVYALGAAVSDISREVLRTVERAVKTTIRRRNNERSQHEHEQQSELHADRGLFNYDSLQLSDYRISCVGTALKLYNEMGEKIYCEALRLIVAAWRGKPDSFRASVLRGMMHFVELYHGEFSEERLVRALGSVHPMEIYRVGRDNPAKLPGWKKYVFPIYMAYNGKGRKDALPMKF